MAFMVKPETIAVAACVLKSFDLCKWGGEGERTQKRGGARGGARGGEGGGREICRQRESQSLLTDTHTPAHTHQHTHARTHGHAQRDIDAQTDDSLEWTSDVQQEKNESASRPFQLKEVSPLLYQVSVTV